MSGEASKGQAALAASDFETAITHLTNALKSSKSPLWLIQRSTAYQRLQKHELALIDAENAVVVAQQRARRELIATAQFRRAISLFSLKRYGDARLALTWCRKGNEKEKGLGLWQANVTAAYERAEKEGRLEEIKTVVKEYPETIVEVGSKEKEEKIEEAKSETQAATSSVGPQPTPKEKIRHDFYQSVTNVTISVMAKGIPKDKAEVVIEAGSLEIRFPTSPTDTFDLTVSPLFARIDPSQSSFRVTPHKIEIILHKSNPGVKWASLEGTEPIDNATSETAAAPPPSRDAAAPAYPTSSRTGPKNWDTIVSDTPEAQEDDDGDNVNSFFKQLYKGADPDTRRAMMKSYQESNGTSLSTNWATVKEGKVETSPPEGVEARRWDQ